jgi:hypothetical protein
MIATLRANSISENYQGATIPLECDAKSEQDSITYFEYYGVCDNFSINYRIQRVYVIIIRNQTQPDTVIPNVYDPQSLNRYMFERGNPYKNKDETGHQACASGECQALYSNPVGWVILGTFFAGYGVYEGGLALREAYPPEEYVYPYIYEYAYAGPRDAWENLIRKTLKDLEEVADWLKQVAEIAVGNELSRRSSQTTIIGDSGSGVVNPNAMNAAQNANQANPQNGGYTASNTLKVGTEYTTSRGVKTSVERTVSSGGKTIIISKPHESSYANIRALIS